MSSPFVSLEFPHQISGTRSQEALCCSHLECGQKTLRTKGTMAGDLQGSKRGRDVFPLLAQRQCLGSGLCRNEGEWPCWLL